MSLSDDDEMLFSDEEEMSLTDANETYLPSYEAMALSDYYQIKENYQDLVLMCKKQILSEFDPEFVRELTIALKISKEIKDTYGDYTYYILGYDYRIYGYTIEDEESFIVDRMIPSLKEKLIQQVEEITQFLSKTRIFKSELYEKQTEMMYHPSRVARLVETGLLSFTDGNSFDDL